MTREEVRKYIRENIVILDGATGTNLMAAGMPVGVCPEKWVMEHPQVIPVSYTHLHGYRKSRTHRRGHGKCNR